MEKSKENCLNCGHKINLQYCEQCGQITSTKRFSLKQLVSVDFIVGFFSLERGFLFTLKSLFTRPGHMVREYIDGKRLTYFHFITFLLLILAISIFLTEYSTFSFADIFSDNKSQKKMMSTLEGLSKKYPRAFSLSQIPIFTLVSFIFFTKAQKNMAEHLILNAYKAAGEIVIAILFVILTFFYKDLTVLWYLYNIVFYGLMILFVTVLYYQFFRLYYENTFKFILRIIFCIITAQMLIGILLGIFSVVQLILNGGVESLKN